MQPVPPQFQDLLGPVLGELIASRGMALTSARAITTLPGATGCRGTYHLEFADGSVLKGRLAPTVPAADAIARINARLDHRHFTEVIAHQNRALLERWVDGVTPTEPVQEHLLARCAQLVAELHEIPWEDAEDGRALTAMRLEELEAELVRHQELGVLSASNAATLRSAARRTLPEFVEVGALHHDFCGENLVVAPNGDPVNIDNGSLRYGVVEEDLARTWYRWPVASAHWEGFASAYWRARRRSFGPSLSPFWCIAVAVRSLSDRQRAGGRRVRFPLAVLERLAETGGRPVSTLDLVPYDADG